MLLSTDSTANLPIEYYNKLGISMIPMQINLEDKVYNDLSEDLPVDEFYKKMHDGAKPTTAQINEYAATQYFTQLLTKGEDVLHISFSSALSGTTTTIKNVAEQLNKTHKNKIVVVDSLNAASGEGLLVLAAHDLIQQGKSIDEIASVLEQLKTKARSLFTVQDLKYLVRGGRLGKVAGFIGKMLNIKPILHVDKDGKLAAFKKVISRRLAIKELFNLTKENIGDTKYVFINHAMCKHDADALAQMLEQINISPVITDLTQVIGCHTGPGLLAVFFFNK